MVTLFQERLGIPRHAAIMRIATMGFLVFVLLGVLVWGFLFLFPWEKEEGYAVPILFKGYERTMQLVEADATAQNAEYFGKNARGPGLFHIYPHWIEYTATTQEGDSIAYIQKIEYPDVFYKLDPAFAEIQEQMIVFRAQRDWTTINMMFIVFPATLAIALFMAFVFLCSTDANAFYPTRRFVWSK